MSTMHKALQHICFSKGISACIAPPGFAQQTSSPVTYTRVHELFMQMTGSKGVVIPKKDREELLMTVSLLTADSNYFVAVIRNQYGSRRVQRLLGKSGDVDAFFYAAILRRFFDIMTDKYASYVANKAMVVFDEVKQHALYEHALHYALDIACDLDGGIALQRVSLRGNFVDLSFKKNGSCIVGKLLEADVSMAVVVMELLECDGDRLMKLACSESGSFVVSRALEVTQRTNRVDLFWGLVQKLMPFRHHLSYVSWNQHCKHLGEVFYNDNLLKKKSSITTILERLYNFWILLKKFVIDVDV